MATEFYSDYTDLQLAGLLSQGDRLAYTEIFERYSMLLIAHAYKLLADQDAANDVVQDVLLNLWQKRERLDLNTSLSAYLYTATRNRIFNRKSHQKIVDRYADTMIAYMEGTHTNSDDFVREKELTAMIEKEIRALPEKMREVFILYKMEDLSYKEIADRLGITDRTARQQVYNALKILKTKIDIYLSLFPFL
ncbi:RNA polymerase sigma-70 factor [Pedobacter africanus]|uniref:RNA polymerase sigma-70 factor (ECF subfamily) n=1 Tax=Pedobacter africanus TaxID=151894 RepID=A0ACC6KQJ4_9SPHI|nr:RNA polymerase sigma-70 factor [Pedobacter africanus]MDR6781476.1 RNA polymerase sigma-70 factor (ECF subfamily) [Pedobacter africanus]